MKEGRAEDVNYIYKRCMLVRFSCICGDEIPVGVGGVGWFLLLMLFLDRVYNHGGGGTGLDWLGLDWT